MSGILAVWNDFPAGLDAFYERWYMGEHLLERVAVPGFRWGRRYEAIAADRRYLTFYEVDGPEVLDSPAYIERLENPTPATMEVMGQWTGMIRALCTVESRAGRHDGAFALSCRLAPGAHGAPDAKALYERWAHMPGLCRVQVWRSVTGEPSQTVEARRRGVPDETVGRALVVEVAREDDLRAIAADIANGAVGGEAALDGAVTGLYRLLCTHRAGE